jgi:hypothetical protein
MRFRQLYQKYFSDCTVIFQKGKAGFYRAVAHGLSGLRADDDADSY